MDALSSLVCAMLGFKQSGGPRYPCHYCGILTILLDAEDFHVCDEHQREYIAIGYNAMMKKYPLAGTDERNPTFFKEQQERRVARGRSLTTDELRLLAQRGCKYEQEYAQAILDGKTLDEGEMHWLGTAAEQYVDAW
ncbi:hypothetical protein H7X87_02545 [Acetobacteraceae bacterium]|nr:hypothetical protein [Candidatus Parcubacteria bacterium]